jgi:ankyrin repeat protein
MKHIKNFESWFTNLFKKFSDHEPDMWEDKMRDIFISSGIDYPNDLMISASEGNWEKFKYYIDKFDVNSIQINTTISGYVANNTNDGDINNALTYVITGDGDLWEKKKMIKALIDKGINPYFKNNLNETFYEMIKDVKLKKWVEQNYPEIVEKIMLTKSVTKYNL